MRTTSASDDVRDGVAEVGPSSDAAAPPGWRAAMLRLAHCTPAELATAAGVVVAVAWILHLPLVDYRFAGGDTITYLGMARDPKGVYWVPLA